MKNLNKTLSVLFLVLAFTLNTTGVANALTDTVELGTATSFAVLAGSGITITGPTTITGNLGTFPTTTITGIGNVTFVSGANHAGDGVTQGAKDALVTAYDDAAGRLPVTTIPTELGGHTYNTGVYTTQSGEFGITGTLTLDGQNNPNAVFVFNAASTLTTATDNSIVLLINEAQPCNVFWQVTSSATIGTYTTFVGNIIAMESITVTTGATINGRVLARGGAVTLDTNAITVDICALPTPTPTPTLTPTLTPRQLRNTNGDTTSSWNIVIVGLAVVSTVSALYSFARRKQTVR